MERKYKGAIYCFKDLKAIYDTKYATEEGKSTCGETIELSIQWEKSDGVVVPISTKELFFRRNMKKIINKSY